MSNYNSILIFKNYIVNKVEYNNNPNFNGDEKGTPINLKIKHIIDINKRSMNVTLITEIFENAEKNNYPFEMNVSITGRFETEEGEPKKFIKNAIAIMYPYIRAIVSTYTASANVPPLILPAINVNKLIEEQEEKKD